MTAQRNRIKTRVALIIGAGDDTGAAVARAFAADGHHVCVVRRPRHLDRLQALVNSIEAEGGSATAFGIDARDPDAMADLVKEIETGIGPIAVTVFNIGANVRFSVVDTTPQVFRKVWEMACYAGFLTVHSVAPAMIQRGEGTIIFTGATASTRGSAGFSVFASAKHGLRALAQSAAKELGPKNIHVAHCVIDGMIDSHFIRENVPGVEALRDADGLISPEDIAAEYVRLHHQPKRAWTFELDLRPFSERW